MTAAGFYIVDFVGAAASLMLLPKTEKKKNFFVSLMMSYVSVLCMGALGALLMNGARIPINLWSMGSVYFVVFFGALAVCVRKKKMQKLFVRKEDILMMGIGVLIVGGISLYIFTPSLRAGYSNPIDPINHYYMAMRVVRSEKINGMFFSALYNGMFINLLKWLLPLNWTYKIFILSDIFHTIMEFWFFYAAAIVLTEKLNQKWLAAAVSIIYWCGFPLLSFAKGGYVYWGMAVMLIEYVLLLLKWYTEEKQFKKTLLPMIILGCYSVAVCYIQLAPGIFLSFFGVVLYEAFLAGTLKINKKSVGIALLGVSIAGICAVVGYYMVFASQNLQIFKVFKIGSMDSPGFDLLAVSPVIVCILMDEYRNRRRWNVFHIALFCYMGIQFVMTLMSAAGLISTYYLFKGYIALWFLVFAVILTKENVWDAQRRNRLKLYVLGVCCFVVLSYNGADTEQFGIQSSVYVQNIAHFVNTDFSTGYLSNGEKINLFRYAVENMSEEDGTIPAVMTNERKGAGALYKAIYEEGCAMVRAEWSKEELEKELDGVDARYFIVFFDDTLYRDQLNDYLNSFERVYQNEDGFIAKRY